MRLAAIGIVAVLGLSRLEALYADAALDNSTWQLEGVAALADKMGALPFLGYSYHLESQSTGDIYRDEAGVMPPSPAEVRTAVLQYMDFTRRDGRLASATEHHGRPGRVDVRPGSDLSPRRASGTMHCSGPANDTAANGLLRVNAMGGGTWITEFETIVGLDSRLFGYSGMYTHASLSPFVDRSIAIYMRQHGYRTSAFFPHGGDFYNARNAYANYGFETILDSEDLGRGAWMETDREVAESVRTAMGPAPQAPFFSYVLFIENHSPHDCGAGDTAGFAVRFADTQEFAPNCALHEYLRRLDSTTAAVQSLQSYLADIEARTGRPYVLLVFGDHQPHTFSSTGGFHYDYSAFRKSRRHAHDVLPHHLVRAGQEAALLLGDSFRHDAADATERIRRQLTRRRLSRHQSLVACPLRHRCRAPRLRQLHEQACTAGSLRSARTRAVPRTNAH